MIVRTLMRCIYSMLTLYKGFLTAKVFLRLSSKLYAERKALAGTELTLQPSLDSLGSIDLSHIDVGAPIGLAKGSQQAFNAEGKSGRR